MRTLFSLYHETVAVHHADFDSDFVHDFLVGARIYAARLYFKQRTGFRLLPLYEHAHSAEIAAHSVADRNDRHNLVRLLPSCKPIVNLWSCEPPA